MCVYIWLVVQCAHLETYESQWEGLSHVLWEKTCSKPPTSIYIYIIIIYNRHITNNIWSTEGFEVSRLKSNPSPDRGLLGTPLVLMAYGSKLRRQSWMYLGKLYYWLVVSTPLKNINQLGWLFRIVPHIWYGNNETCSKPPTRITH